MRPPLHLQYSVHAIVSLRQLQRPELQPALHPQLIMSKTSPGAMKSSVSQKQAEGLTSASPIQIQVGPV